MQDVRPERADDFVGLPEDFRIKAAVLIQKSDWKAIEKRFQVCPSSSVKAQRGSLEAVRIDRAHELHHKSLGAAIFEAGHHLKYPNLPHR
jgi:hypothetical protein